MHHLGVRCFRGTLRGYGIHTPFPRRARERSIASALPEPIAPYNAPKEKPKIQVFEGEDGMKLLYKELCESLNNIESEEIIKTYHALFGNTEIVAPESIIKRRIIGSPSFVIMVTLTAGNSEACPESKNDIP